MGNILQEIFDFENEVLSFIKNNQPSYFVLKKHFYHETNTQGDIVDTIDNLLFEKKIKIFYPEGSQVYCFTTTETG